jgi:PIN domain nuclease of toxin-antitoxin system
LWEIEKLYQLGRIALDPLDKPFRTMLSSITVWPIDLNVITALRRLDFRGDPADELIAATSIAVQAPLITRDRRILASKVVPMV